MSNNKQSSVELLFQDMLKLTTALIPEGKTRYELMKESYEHHKAMHKEEIIEANEAGFDDGNGFVEEMKYKTSGHYYNETFGNEQQ